MFTNALQLVDNLQQQQQQQQIMPNKVVTEPNKFIDEILTHRLAQSVVISHQRKNIIRFDYILYT